MLPDTLTGLFKVVDEGNLSKHEEFANVNSLDITKNVRMSILSDLLRTGIIPQAGTDDFNALKSLLNDIDKQDMDLRKLDVEINKNSNINEALKQLFLVNPGSFMSAQQQAEEHGANPSEDYEVKYDKSRFDEFQFKEGELGSSDHGKTYTDCLKVVADYQKAELEKAQNS